MANQNSDTEQYHALAKNSLWVLVSQLSMVFILLLTILASRILGDHAFGQYVFLLAVSTILADLSVLGTTDYAAIRVARESHRTAHIVANALGLRIPLLIIFLAASEFVTWLSMPEALLAGLFIALDWAARTIIHLLRGVLRSRNRFGSDARVATIERVSVLICAATALYIDETLVSFAVGFFVGRFAGLLACFAAYLQLGERLYIAFDQHEWERLFRGGCPIGVRGVLKGISFRIDAIMLGFLQPLAEVGWYGAAYKLLEASFLFQSTVGLALQPPIARAYGQHNTDQAADLYGRAYKLLLVAGAAVTALGFVYADTVIFFVFGEEYRPAAAALAILVWAMLAVFSSMTSLVLLDAVDSGKKTVFPFAVAAVGNIILNAILIPHFGYIGAAWSTLVTELFLAIVLLHVSIADGYRFPSAWFSGPLLACLVFTATALLFKWLNWGWLGTLLSFVAFLAVLLAVRVFDQTDRNYFRFLLGRVRIKKEL